MESKYNTAGFEINEFNEIVLGCKGVYAPETNLYVQPHNVILKDNVFY